MQRGREEEEEKGWKMDGSGGEGARVNKTKLRRNWQEETKLVQERTLQESSNCYFVLDIESCNCN